MCKRIGQASKRQDSERAENLRLSLMVDAIAPVGVYFNPAPPYDPIDWSRENEWLFLKGVMRVDEMTKEQFARRYPDTLPPDS